MHLFDAVEEPRGSDPAQVSSGGFWVGGSGDCLSVGVQGVVVVRVSRVVGVG